MEKTMDMTIAAPEGILFEGKVESVKLPGVSGTFTILPRHAALISALSAGHIVYSLGSEVRETAIQSGFVEVNKNRISVCVEI